MDLFKANLEEPIKPGTSDKRDVVLAFVCFGDDTIGGVRSEYAKPRFTMEEFILYTLFVREFLFFRVYKFSRVNH